MPDGVAGVLFLYIMNIHKLREAQVRFENRLERVIDARKQQHYARQSFIKHFNKSFIEKMSIDDYNFLMNKRKCTKYAAH